MQAWHGFLSTELRNIKNWKLKLRSRLEKVHSHYLVSLIRQTHASTVRIMYLCLQLRNRRQLWESLTKAAKRNWVSNFYQHFYWLGFPLDIIDTNIWRPFSLPLSLTRNTEVLGNSSPSYAIHAVKFPGLGLQTQHINWPRTSVSWVVKIFHFRNFPLFDRKW